MKRDFAVGAVYDRALYWTGFEAYRIKRAVIDRAYRGRTPCDARL